MTLTKRCQNLKRRYGITHEDYEKMLKLQGGVCKICGTNEPGFSHKFFVVDHCHDSNKIRGLLCHNCNTMLGHARDSTATLSEAIVYLDQARAKWSAFDSSSSPSCCASGA
jgi:hypothetical protein|tara:strand:- start:10840 stop:11172 length:333 start_codon:yes stop_codon:yes gene_type:complete